MSGPVNLNAHPEANVLKINTAQEMLNELQKIDLKVMVMALWNRLKYVLKIGEMVD